MSSKHTPAPWATETYDIVAMDHKRNMSVLARIDGTYHNGDGEPEANARLIAAAPDLLAAAFPDGKPTVAEILRSHGYGHEADAIDAAVAKATGRRRKSHA